MAFSHSPDPGDKWQYDSNCCSTTDCHPIDNCDELYYNTDGSVKWDKYTFSRDSVRASGNTKCHVCIHANGDRPLCVYILPSS